jgi:hypothetical protein
MAFIKPPGECGQIFRWFQKSYFNRFKKKLNNVTEAEIADIQPIALILKLNIELVLLFIEKITSF